MEMDVSANTYKCGSLQPLGAVKKILLHITMSRRGLNAVQGSKTKVTEEEEDMYGGVTKVKSYLNAYSNCSYSKVFLYGQLPLFNLKTGPSGMNNVLLLVREIVVHKLESNCSKLFLNIPTLT